MSNSSYESRIEHFKDVWIDSLVNVLPRCVESSSLVQRVTNRHVILDTPCGSHTVTIESKVDV